jgi:hypothetical protein
MAERKPSGAFSDARRDPPSPLGLRLHGSVRIELGLSWLNDRHSMEKSNEGRSVIAQRH